MTPVTAARRITSDRRGFEITRLRRVTDWRITMTWLATYWHWFAFGGVAFLFGYFLAVVLRRDPVNTLKARCSNASTGEATAHYWIRSVDSLGVVHYLRFTDEQCAEADIRATANKADNPFQGE
jgi:hypothetical protein